MPIKCQSLKLKLTPTSLYKKSSLLRKKLMTLQKLPNGVEPELLWSYWHLALPHLHLPKLLSTRPISSKFNKSLKSKTLPSSSIQLLGMKPFIFGSSSRLVKLPFAPLTSNLLTSIYPKSPNGQEYLLLRGRED